MSPQQKTLSVPAIREGTVIDHLKAGSALQIIRMLNLHQSPYIVTVGLNLPSSAIGTKDMIKISGHALTEDETSKIAIFAPQATINIVQDYEVARKFRVQPPATIAQLIICPNSHCITHQEHMPSLFTVKQQKETIWLRCKYCEKSFTQGQIQEFNFQDYSI